jgi:molybdopterin-guanine dinucleotide biosynthesis protein A
MGRDKALILIDGETCISRIVNALEMADKTPIRISVSDTECMEIYNKSINPKIDVEWVLDSQKHAGPIESIIENLRDPVCQKYDLVQLVTVDVPWVTGDFFTSLSDSIEDNDCLIMPTDGKKLHPLLSLIRPKIVLNKLIRGGTEPLYSQFSKLKHSLFLELPEVMKNLNHPEDLE